MYIAIMSTCAGCGKEYTAKTLQKYDGKYCGRCYKKTLVFVDPETPPLPAIDSSPTAIEIVTTTAGADLPNCADDDIDESSFKYKISKIFNRLTFREPILPLYVAPAPTPTPAPSPKPRKRAVIPSAVRTQVWNTWISENSMVGPCFVCAKPIQFTNFHAAHVLADASGGEVSVSNLRPTCALCNTSMGTTELFEFIAKYQMLPNNPQLLPVNSRALLDKFPPAWTRHNVVNIVCNMMETIDIDQKDIFQKWILYISWMLFEDSKTRPDHIDLFLLNIGMSDTPTGDAEPVIDMIVVGASSIWGGWLKNSADSIERDVKYYDVYLGPYDKYA